ncbi:hypothetical protein [Pseudomonas sp. RIT-PI-AD]|uniref:hypothetical protein n=1 Tax=Pseudomonas sp. RIT-PI-AD TaxID=3035294 RepID=UPI0021D9D87C|nr:hypothetical protein [Pseudomonas sp. RIT-PI-AD]
MSNPMPAPVPPSFYLELVPPRVTPAADEMLDVLRDYLGILDHYLEGRPDPNLNARHEAFSNLPGLFLNSFIHVEREARDVRFDPSSLAQLLAPLVEGSLPPADYRGLIGRLAEELHGAGPPLPGGPPKRLLINVIDLEDGYSTGHLGSFECLASLRGAPPHEAIAESGTLDGGGKEAGNPIPSKSGEHPLHLHLAVDWGDHSLATASLPLARRFIQDMRDQGYLADITERRTYLKLVQA